MNVTDCEKDSKVSFATLLLDFPKTTNIIFSKPTVSKVNNEHNYKVSNRRKIKASNKVNQSKKTIICCEKYLQSARCRRVICKRRNASSSKIFIFQ